MLSSTRHSGPCSAARMCLFLGRRVKHGNMGGPTHRVDIHPLETPNNVPTECVCVCVCVCPYLLQTRQLFANKLTVATLLSCLRRNSQRGCLFPAGPPASQPAAGSLLILFQLRSSRPDVAAAASRRPRVPALIKLLASLWESIAF